MPRILRIINRLNLGGITYNVAYLTRYLQPSYKTLLLAGPAEDSEESSQFILDTVGVQARILPEMHRAINPMQDWRALTEIKRVIKEYKPDIVHTHAAKAGMLGRLAAWQMKVPVIVHTFHGHVFHSYFSPAKTRFFIESERWLAAKSTAIVAISDLQKEELTNQYRITTANKIHTIPLGFDLSRFQEQQDAKRANFRIKYQISDDEIAIGIVGRLVPIKNHILFLQAIQLLKNRTAKPFRVFIIGDGELKATLEQSIVKMGLDYVNYAIKKRKALVTLTSWVTNIDEAYAGLDIVALSSLNEGTPVSLIEAQAAGKPIVTTQVGGVANAVLPNKTALLVESNNTEAFAEALLQLLENETMRKAFAEAGWPHVQDKYHYTRLVNDMKGLYDKLLT